MLNKCRAFEGNTPVRAMEACLRRMEFSCRRAVLIVANQKIRPPRRNARGVTVTNETKVWKYSRRCVNIIIYGKPQTLCGLPDDHRNRGCVHERMAGDLTGAGAGSYGISSNLQLRPSGGIAELSGAWLRGGASVF